MTMVLLSAPGFLCLCVALYALRMTLRDHRQRNKQNTEDG